MDEVTKWCDVAFLARLSAVTTIEVAAATAKREAETQRKLAAGYRAGEFGEENAQSEEEVEAAAGDLEAKAASNDALAMALAAALGELPAGVESEAAIEAVRDLRARLEEAGEEVELVELAIASAKASRRTRRRLLFELLRDEASRRDAPDDFLEVGAPDELARQGAALFADYTWRSVRGPHGYTMREAACGFESVKEILDDSGFNVHQGAEMGAIPAGMYGVLGALVDACRLADSADLPPGFGVSSGLDLETLFRRQKAFAAAGLEAPSLDVSALEVVGRRLVDAGLVEHVLRGALHGATSAAGRVSFERDGVIFSDYIEEKKLEEDEEVDGELLAGASDVLDTTIGGRLLHRRLSEFSVDYTDNPEVGGLLVDGVDLGRFDPALEVGEGGEVTIREVSLVGGHGQPLPMCPICDEGEDGREWADADQFAAEDRLAGVREPDAGCERCGGAGEDRPGHPCFCVFE